MKSFVIFLFILCLAPLQEVIGQDSGEQLQISAILTIKEGQLENFKAVAKKCIKNTREKDTGTLQYDWFLDEEGGTCVVREIYASSDAVLSHIENT